MRFSDSPNPQNEATEPPKGVENLSLDKKRELIGTPIESKEQKFKIEQIDQELKQKLNEAGVKIEMTRAMMNLAMYDESEKTLKIRQDANAGHVNDYIRDTVLKKPEEPAPIDPNEGELEDLHLNNDN